MIPMCWAATCRYFSLSFSVSPCYVEEACLWGGRSLQRFPRKRSTLEAWFLQCVLHAQLNVVGSLWALPHMWQTRVILNRCVCNHVLQLCTYDFSKASVGDFFRWLNMASLDGTWLIDFKDYKLVNPWPLYSRMILCILMIPETYYYYYYKMRDDNANAGIQSYKHKCIHDALSGKDLRGTCNTGICAQYSDKIWQKQHVTRQVVARLKEIHSDS